MSKSLKFTLPSTVDPKMLLLPIVDFVGGEIQVRRNKNKHRSMICRCKLPMKLSGI